MIVELHYSNTNTYYVQGTSGALLVDTGWAGMLPQFLQALGAHDLRLQDIRYLLITHFHPDHMGIAQDIAEHGVTIAVMDVQRPFLHAADAVLLRDPKLHFQPIVDAAIRLVPLADSRAFLGELGLAGEILHTPGHSDDSVSLWLDREKALFVGDLNPLYELELHRGTTIGDSWEKLLKRKPRTVYYGHAKTAELRRNLFGKTVIPEHPVYAEVRQIMGMIDGGHSAEEIRELTGAELTFIEDVARMYLTHPGVSVQGILDRIEIKGR